MGNLMSSHRAVMKTFLYNYYFICLYFFFICWESSHFKLFVHIKFDILKDLFVSVLHKGCVWLFTELFICLLHVSLHVFMLVDKIECKRLLKGKEISFEFTKF